MRLLESFLRIFFILLYHPFAWTYDFVAWTVSLGRWKSWVECVIPYIKGKRVLELGHGPGHLQAAMFGLNLVPFGLDESRQMGKIAKKRLDTNGYPCGNLARGVAQSLPFPDGVFDSIVATFPSEYILDSRTLAEVSRTLAYNGRFIILPVAWVTGNTLLDRLAAWLFRVTGQAPSDLSQTSINNFIKPVIHADFQVEVNQLELLSSRVMIVIASK